MGGKVPSPAKPALLLCVPLSKTMHGKAVAINYAPVNYQAYEFACGCGSVRVLWMRAYCFVTWFVCCVILCSSVACSECVLSWYVHLCVACCVLRGTCACVVSCCVYYLLREPTTTKRNNPTTITSLCALLNNNLSPWIYTLDFIIWIS